MRRIVASPHLATALRRLPGNRTFVDDGAATVVIVNWQSLEYLAVAVEAIRRFSPTTTQILVVDNASTDGSGRWLRKRDDVRALLLPANIHHGPAMDLGFLVARTQYVVSMDVDAFPLSTNWLPRVLGPLTEGDLVSGVVSQRAFVHPCLLAMERRTFVEDGHSFRSRPGDHTGPDAWDTGELITRRCEPRVHRIEATDHIGPYWVGTSWSDIAYHNMYAVRHLLRYADERDAPTATLDFGITRQHALDAWAIATERHLGLDEEARRQLAALDG